MTAIIVQNVSESAREGRAAGEGRGGSGIVAPDRVTIARRSLCDFIKTAVSAFSDIYCYIHTFTVLVAAVRAVGSLDAAEERRHFVAGLPTHLALRLASALAANLSDIGSTDGIDGNRTTGAMMWTLIEMMSGMGDDEAEAVGGAVGNGVMWSDGSIQLILAEIERRKEMGECGDTDELATFLDSFGIDSADARPAPIAIPAQPIIINEATIPAVSNTPTPLDQHPDIDADTNSSEARATRRRDRRDARQPHHHHHAPRTAIRNDRERSFQRRMATDSSAPSSPLLVAEDRMDVDVPIAAAPVPPPTLPSVAFLPTPQQFHSIMHQCIIMARRLDRADQVIQSLYIQREILHGRRAPPAGAELGHPFNPPPPPYVCEVVEVVVGQAGPGPRTRAQSTAVHREDAQALQ
ncbi:hypothetical protein RQP46_002998 [Phenoliferia psychrophenolica]